MALASLDSWPKSETSESFNSIEKSDLISAKDCWKIKVVTTRVRNKQDFILQGLFKSDLFGKDFLMLFYRLSFSFLTSGNWAQEFGPIVIILEIVTDQSSVLLFCQNRTEQVNQSSVSPIETEQNRTCKKHIKT